jgi:ligand-binding sensor domain-containing protein
VRPAALVVAASLAAVPAQAERLPLRAYGTTEGLPSTDVQRIRSDSRGLIWFATRDGLARFDGARFTVYGPDQGLPVPTVNDVIEARRGGYWVATNGGGVCWLDPAAPIPPRDETSSRLFQCTRVGEDATSSSVNMVVEDGSETLWAATDGGLFRRSRGEGFTRVDLAAPAAASGHRCSATRRAHLD